MWTWEGFLDLATVTVIDCHTKECVGYAVADHLGTELLITALNMVRPGFDFSSGCGSLLGGDQTPLPVASEVGQPSGRTVAAPSTTRSSAGSRRTPRILFHWESRRMLSCQLPSRRMIRRTKTSPRCPALCLVRRTETSSLYRPCALIGPTATTWQSRCHCGVGPGVSPCVTGRLVGRPSPPAGQALIQPYAPRGPALRGPSHRPTCAGRAGAG